MPLSLSRFFLTASFLIKPPPACVVKSASRNQATVLIDECATPQTSPKKRRGKVEVNMKILTALLLTAMLVALGGCTANRKEASISTEQASPQDVVGEPSRSAAESPRPDAEMGRSIPGDTRGLHPGSVNTQRQQSGSATTQTVSLQKADEVQAQSQAVDRKIIRNGNLIIEIDEPQDGLRQITSVAESLGGFVVTSEFKQNDSRAVGKPAQIVTVIVRVPSLQFNAALEGIRPLGRVIQEKSEGQDVTEEYIDLEARIKAKKALEAQFMEIMKRASRVTEALEVQSQIADVRGQIESLEGRRRFLENRAALSTINITLQTSAPVVTATTSGFWHDVKQAFGDGVDTAAAIVTGLVRVLIVMIPVTLLILLPLFLAGRYLFRRFGATRKQPPIIEPQSQL
jgi:hypothetical protein